MMTLASTVNAKAIELGKHVITMTTKAGSGHPSSGLSLAHIVIMLMEKRMRYDPKNPSNPASDRLVLSEGHAVPIVYAVYADVGGVAGKDPSQLKKVTLDDLNDLRELDSVLDGHPNPAEGFPFFDAATGSLGQGLSVAAGLALAARLRGTDRRIFTIIGDGESREGQIWEAADFIVDRKLTNVCAIFNCNGQGQADVVSHQQSAEVLTAKLKAFGWKVRAIDGHDVKAIGSALNLVGKGGQPVAIVAKTVKGWGTASLQGKGNHGKPLKESEVPGALADLDAMYDKLGVPRGSSGGLRIHKPKGEVPPLPSGEIRLPSFDEAMAEAGLADAVAKNKLATRRAFGAALLALGKADERVVSLDGDVSNSTFAEYFAKKLPDRFFECKIAEQNMISAAAGLAAAGYIPFASSFAKFLSRGYDQIEMANITRANIKIVGSHAGVSLAADGPSQMGLVDVTYFRSFGTADDGRGRPACVSFQPADAVAAYHLTGLMANVTGMCYMRTHRPDVALLYDKNASFEVGGSSVLRQGDALTIVSSGYMISVVLKATEALAGEGIQCTVVDAYSLPMNAQPVLAAGAKTGGKILTVEDNYGGGLGGAVAEAAAITGKCTVQIMTCKRIPKSGNSPEDVLSLVGLTAGDIAARVKDILK
ncbi:MAG: transketolase [Phycisphaerae bacterium]|nr:transketolase [Phycisphaerae bacterium]